MYISSYLYCYFIFVGLLNITNFSYVAQKEITYKKMVCIFFGRTMLDNR